jgi:hypothetical protein
MGDVIGAVPDGRLLDTRRGNAHAKDALSDIMTLERRCATEAEMSLESFKTNQRLLATNYAAGHKRRTTSL